MRKQYYWDAELKQLEKTMTHEAAALKISGYDPGENAETFECNFCGESFPVSEMAPPVVRGDVPVIMCLNCADEGGFPAV